MKFNLQCTSAGPYLPCTGCAVTPYSVVSPASCQISADRRGGGDSLPEEVGGPAGTGICCFSPVEAAVTMAEAKRQQVAALLHTGMTITDICQSVGVSERLIFKVKKLIKEGKDLKIIRTGGPKMKKRTAATIRRVAAKIERDP